jgi:hypothetical protein
VVARTLTLGLCLVASTAFAGGAARVAKPEKKPAAPAKPSVWIGVFHPAIPAHDPWTNDKLTPMVKGGSVRVLSPSDGGAAASGEVVIVHPLLSKVANGTIANGAVALAEFAYDQRDGDAGVLVLPGGTKVAVVPTTKEDAAAIRARLARNEALAGVRKALVGLEIATIDSDGDGKADLAVTYGCTQWAGGTCQAHGQFFLAKRAGRGWIEFE